MILAKEEKSNNRSAANAGVSNAPYSTDNDNYYSHALSGDYEDEYLNPITAHTDDHHTYDAIPLKERFIKSKFIVCFSVQARVLLFKSRL